MPLLRWSPSSWSWHCSSASVFINFDPHCSESCHSFFLLTLMTPTTMRLLALQKANAICCCGCVTTPDNNQDVSMVRPWLQDEPAFLYCFQQQQQKIVFYSGQCGKLITRLNTRMILINTDIQQKLTLNSKEIKSFKNNLAIYIIKKLTYRLILRNLAPLNPICTCNLFIIIFTHGKQKLFLKENLTSLFPHMLA